MPGTLPKDHERRHHNSVGHLPLTFTSQLTQEEAFRWPRRILLCHFVSRSCLVSSKATFSCLSRSILNSRLVADGVSIAFVFRRYAMLAWSYIPVAIAGYWAYVSSIFSCFPKVLFTAGLTYAIISSRDKDINGLADRVPCEV